MSLWCLYNRVDTTRFLRCRDGQWFADPATTAALNEPDLQYALTPVGPVLTGIRNESELYAAARSILGNTEDVGDIPPYPPLDPVPDGSYS